MTLCEEMVHILQSNKFMSNTHNKYSFIDTEFEITQVQLCSCTFLLLALSFSFVSHETLMDFKGVGNGR